MRELRLTDNFPNSGPPHRVIRIGDLGRQTDVRAVANGVRLGRKPTLTYHQQEESIKRLNAGRETQGEIACSYNVSRWTISRLAP
jgi:hypothetical protein